MVRKRIHIVTVGASLLTNAANYEEIKNMLGTSRIDQIEEKLRNSKVNKNELFKKLIRFLEQRGDEASAEIASMAKFLKEKKIDFAYLLYTDTEVGDLCSRVLSSYLRNGYGLHVETVKVNGYRDEIAFSKEGLANLAMRVWDLIKKHKESDRVYICATGGFKPETAIVTLIANLHGVSVYYRHETFRTHIAIPGLPVEWNYQIMKKYSAALIELINKRIPKEEFHRKFGEQIADEMENDYWLIKEVDGYYELMPIGRLLYHVLFGG
ncbi:MAG: putative CRISPR-associated protein [Aigarchaeota archaeon]|nr:putative CRISPR-associated protein [Candidatus Pelearchaeum maunauluense]